MHTTDFGECIKIVRNAVRQLLLGEKLTAVLRTPIPSLLPWHRTELSTTNLLALVVDIFSSTTKSAIDREPNHGTSSFSRDHQMGIDGV